LPGSPSRPIRPRARRQTARRRFDPTADRLETAQKRQTRILALTIDEREQILATLVDCPPSLGELRAIVLQEAVWRDREGL